MGGLDTAGGEFFHHFSNDKFYCVLQLLTVSDPGAFLNEANMQNYLWILKYNYKLIIRFSEI